MDPRSARHGHADLHGVGSHVEDPIHGRQRAPVVHLGLESTHGIADAITHGSGTIGGLRDRQSSFGDQPGQLGLMVEIGGVDHQTARHAHDAGQLGREVRSGGPATVAGRQGQNGQRAEEAAAELVILERVIEHREEEVQAGGLAEQRRGGRTGAVGAQLVQLLLLIGGQAIRGSVGVGPLTGTPEVSEDATPGERILPNRAGQVSAEERLSVGRSSRLFAVHILQRRSADDVRLTDAKGLANQAHGGGRGQMQAGVVHRILFGGSPRGPVWWLAGRRLHGGDHRPSGKAGEMDGPAGEAKPRVGVRSVGRLDGALRRHLRRSGLHFLQGPIDQDGVGEIVVGRGQDRLGVVSDRRTPSGRERGAYRRRLDGKVLPPHAKLDEGLAVDAGRPPDLGLLA